MTTKITDEQLEEYLAACNEADLEEEVIDEASSNNTEAMLDESTASLSETNPMPWITNDVRREGVKTRTANQEALRRRKQAIKRQLALENKAYSLTDFITNRDKRLIIAKLTESFTDSIKATRKTIDKRIAGLIKPMIPNKIKVARTVCGNTAFIAHPGFMWICPPMYGSHKLWVNPDIPYYFEQFTELKALEQRYNADQLGSVHRLVDKYVNALVLLAKREASLAIKLTRVDTMEDLLNFDPDMYEFIIEQKKEKVMPTEESTEELAEELAETIDDKPLSIEDIEAEMLAKYS